jgi:hypothetical protein
MSIISFCITGLFVSLFSVCEHILNNCIAYIDKLARMFSKVVDKETNIGFRQHWSKTHGT